MKGYLYITSSNYDPEKGKHIKDPYLGKVPTLGACMPQIRRWVIPGDHIMVLSGKVPGVQQFVIADFEVEDKIDALAAYHRFPDLRLRKREDGQLTGNVIVDSKGKQHPLDKHSGFHKRISNYLVGRDPVVLTTPEEIQRGRESTMPMLRSVLHKNGDSPFKIVGRGGTKLDADQVTELRHWLKSLKSPPAR